MPDEFSVVASAGSLRSSGPSQVRFPHRWTEEGVAVETEFTGAHLLHLSAAACVLNDLYREAANLGIDLRGVRVVAAGGFNTDTWQSSGITYRVEVDSPADQQTVANLLGIVDDVAEIPRALRQGASVTRA